MKSHLQKHLQNKHDDFSEDVFALERQKGPFLQEAKQTSNFNALLQH